MRSIITWRMGGSRTLPGTCTISVDFVSVGRGGFSRMTMGDETDGEEKEEEEEDSGDWCGERGV